MMKKDAGFTLIELMVTITIIAILAAIAIPSYRQYVIRNAEAQVQSKMQQLEIELNRWRSSNLSYKGFRPEVVRAVGDKDCAGTIVTGSPKVDYCYDDTGNSVIYVPPKPSNIANIADYQTYKYRIILKSVVTNGDSVTSESLVVSNGTQIDSASLAIGQNWAMLAVPNENIIPKAKKMLLLSNGTRCKTKQNESVDITSSDCGTYSEQW